MSADRHVGVMASPASPRPILMAADPIVSSKAVIVRPTPRRPGQEHAKARSHDDVAAVDGDNLGKVMDVDHAKRSLTDPRQTRSTADGGLSAMEGCLPAPVRMRSAALSSPPTKDFGPSKESNAFVTNLVIDRGVDSSEDSGYQILSQRDEEVERGLGGRQAGPHRHHFPPKGPTKMAHKVRGKKKSSPGHEHLPVEGSNRLENASSRLLDVKAALERLKQDVVISTDGDLDGDDFDEDDEDDDDDEDDSSTSTYSTTSADSEFEAALSDKHSNGHAGVSSNGHGKANGKQSVAHSEARTKVCKNVSQDTLNTTVISADEFVWIDSHNRLVELQQVPWTTHDLVQVIARALESDCDHVVNGGFGSATAASDRIGADVLPRISYYLQRALVRLAREAQRLSKPVGRCGRREIWSSVRVVLPPSLATAAVRACLRSSAMYAVSGRGSDSTRQSRSSRAGLLLSVGRMGQWMGLVRVGRYVHELASVYLTAVVESLLEAVVAECVSSYAAGREASSFLMTAPLLEQAVSASPDLWGLFQPYAHLTSGRVAAGTLALSPVVEAIASGSGVAREQPRGGNSSHVRNMRQILLTTCVGSADELEEMVLLAGGVFQKVWQLPATSTSTSSSSSGCPTPAPNSTHSASGGAWLGVAPSARSGVGVSRWSPEAVRSLYHFMRCSQLEYVGQDGKSPIQELVYERPYMVLPPVGEWVRVACAFSEHRSESSWLPMSVVDADDVMQAARVLLPGMDCPARSLFSPIASASVLAYGFCDDGECVQLMKRDMAFSLLMSGRRDLVAHALQLLPASSSVRNQLDVVSFSGLTPLQLASLNGDLNLMRILLDAGADVDGLNREQGDGEHRCWTPLAYAALGGHFRAVKLLLERGAKPEGAPEASTETPLQLAAAAGNARVAEVLMSFGASPMHSTAAEDASKAGCYSPLSVAAAHGHRRLLHLLVTHSMASQSRAASAMAVSDTVSLNDRAADEEVLSLEEILAEGLALSPKASAEPKTPIGHGFPHPGQPPRVSGNGKLSKAHLRRLQESLYHACESGHVEMALDLRAAGVPWTLFAWLQALRVAHDGQAAAVVTELLQDFRPDWLDERAAVLTLGEEGLPLLFSVFRACRGEAATLMLADVFALCFAKTESHKVELQIFQKQCDDEATSSPRIDPRFVNSPELSDVQFRVDGRTFYAHRLALVSASPRFRSMLSSRFSGGDSGGAQHQPVLQINDIRYEIFHLVMTYLYSGGPASSVLKIEAGDVLELMAAANFFQLPGLLSHCEAVCARLVDIDNIVSYYIHAKVYAAGELIEFCEGFILKNLVALLTYDDSVRRLLFGKKLQNHDVLAGLQTTLQKRIKMKWNAPNSLTKRT